MRYRPYIPQDIGELLDHLAYMMRQNIDTAFVALNEGLLVIRKKLGEGQYATLNALSDKMRALFEADPEDKTGEARAGRAIIHEMEDILRSAAKQEGWE